MFKQRSLLENVNGWNFSELSTYRYSVEISRRAIAVGKLLENRTKENVGSAFILRVYCKHSEYESCYRENFEICILVSCYNIYNMRSSLNKTNNKILYFYSFCNYSAIKYIGTFQSYPNISATCAVIVYVLVH